MSDLKATVAETAAGFDVRGCEEINYGFTFLDGVFDTQNNQLADCYKKWGRCLAVMDYNIFSVYGEQVQNYFDHYDINLDVHKTMIGEKAKSIDTFLSIVDSMNKFGIYRKVGPPIAGGKQSIFHWNIPEADRHDVTGAGFSHWRWTCY